MDNSNTLAEVEVVDVDADRTPAAQPKSQSTAPSASTGQSITIDMMRPHFDKPAAAAAKALRVSATALLKARRKHGVGHWPYRDLLVLRKGIQKTKDDARNAVEPQVRAIYLEQLKQMELHLVQFQSRGVLHSVSPSPNAGDQYEKDVGRRQKRHRPPPCRGETLGRLLLAVEHESYRDSPPHGRRDALRVPPGALTRQPRTISASSAVPTRPTTIKCPCVGYRQERHPLSTRQAL